MAWKPIQPKSKLTPRMRELISRGTSTLVALLLLYGSYRTLSWCIRVRAEAVEQAQKTATAGSRTRVISGTGLPFVIGGAMGLLGIVALLGAVMPVSFWERFTSPPGDPEEEAANLKKILRRGRL